MGQPVRRPAVELSTADTEPTLSVARGRARGFMLGLAALLILIDLLIGAVEGPRAIAELEDADDLRRYLRATTQAEGAPWLLIGDSVLVGDTGQAELADWHEHRLIDYLERELGGHEDAVFRQVAFSGMLPVDMLAVVEALEREDPDAHVSLLLELSPRYFSGAYAQVETPSRPWFAELGEGARGSSLPSMDETLRFVRRWTPVYRHRDRFLDTRERLAGVGETRSVNTAEPGDRVEALARLSIHYRDPQLDPASVQVEALLEITRRCRESGRRLALFTVPLEDQFVAGLGRASAQGEYLAGLDALLAPDGRQITLLPMDHPQFRSELFWDHVHLRPDGHRALAINLLHQLGLDLERLPSEQQLIAPWGIDASLVARVGAGSSNGAAWQAQFESPRGVAVSPDGRQIVIADTGNHVLRQLHGDLRVVSTLAGTPGVAGERDGSPELAELDGPSSPLFVGESIYFVDDEGRRLRRLDSSEVQTLRRVDDGWRIQALGAHEHRLYMLQSRDAQTRILALEPNADDTTSIVSGGADPGLQISAFTLSPTGELYLAAANGQIFRTKASAKGLELGAPDPEQLSVVFENLGGTVLPQKGGASFPCPFEDIHLTEIVGLEYVERYGGLLVQDLAPHPRTGAYNNPVTERAQLRFLDLERELVFPWLKPLVVGLGYFYFNQSTQGFTSYYHEGSMALDQGSATLVYLEAGRSRLLRLEDGLLGVSKIGQYSLERLGFRDMLAARTGERALVDHDPTRFFGRSRGLGTSRGDELEPRGPYVWLLMGSSMMSMSELVGQYSLGRELALGLGRDLALREGVELHTFQRTLPGGRLTRQIAAIKRFMKTGRPDIISIEANASTFLPEDTDDAFMVEQLERLTKLARRWDSKLVIIDTSPYIVRNREALRPAPAQVTRFLELARGRGFEVVDVADPVLDRHLEVAPFASPPIVGIHPPPWAIDAIADEMVAVLSPMFRAWLRERSPALRAEGPESASEARTKPLAEAFEALDSAWAQLLPRVPIEAVQVDFDGKHLIVFVDLALLPPALRDGALDELVLAVVYDRVVRLHDGARTADIVIGRFERYDEYGAGVDEGATIVRRDQFEYETLVAALRKYGERSG